jgi:hypothetical protein
MTVKNKCNPKEEKRHVEGITTTYMQHVLCEEEHIRYKSLLKIYQLVCNINCVEDYVSSYNSKFVVDQIRIFMLLLKLSVIINGKVCNKQMQTCVSRRRCFEELLY